MPTDIRVIHARDFMRATVDGALDLATSTRLLLDLAAAGSALGDPDGRVGHYDLIVDTRRAQLRMSVVELWQLATELSSVYRAAPRPRRTAILCPLVDFDSASFYALCAENRGYRVQAFTSFEDAIEWLCAVSA